MWFVFFRFVTYATFFEGAGSGCEKQATLSALQPRSGKPLPRPSWIPAVLTHVQNTWPRLLCLSLSLSTYLSLGEAVTFPIIFPRPEISHLRRDAFVTTQQSMWVCGTYSSTATAVLCSTRPSAPFSYPTYHMRVSTPRCRMFMSPRRASQAWVDPSERKKAKKIKDRLFFCCVASIVTY